MEEIKSLPSNSHKSREIAKVEQSETKNFPSVVREGSATIKKSNGFTKIARSIIAEDMRSVGQSIVYDIIIPATKKTIDDIVSNAIHMALYGRTAEPKNSSFASKISYGGFFKQSTNTLKANAGPNVLDFDNVVFDTRGEADAALELMKDILESGYSSITVNDFYEIAKIKDFVPDWTYNKYGWTSMRGVEARKCFGQDGYYLTLPPAKEL